MVIFKSSLKNRLYFLLIILILCVPLFMSAIFYLEFNFSIGLSVFFILMFILGHNLINYFYKPFAELIESIETGLSCLRDNDFSVNLTKPAYNEFSQSIDIYNQLANILRTERLEMYQRELLLDTVIQSTPMAIVLTNERGIVVYSNIIARKLLKHPHRIDSLNFDELVGNLPEELKQATRDKKEGLYNLNIDDEKQVYYLNFQEFNLNGQIHCLYIYKNMTSEVSKEEILIWKKVIRLISHELNNSLAPIQSLTHSAKKIINQQSGNQMLVDILETIDRRSKHLHNFIEKYAKFSRLPNPQFNQVNLQKFVASLEKICDVKIITDNLSHEARFDPIQIEQVIINLVKNARESEGDIQKIQMEISRHSDFLTFTIKDRGKGMTEEQLKQSLLPFFTTKSTGSGLGLALCNDIINAHQGRLKLTNRVNGGLLVSFKIPA